MAPQRHEKQAMTLFALVGCYCRAIAGGRNSAAAAFEGYKPVTDEVLVMAARYRARPTEMAKFETHCCQSLAQLIVMQVIVNMCINGSPAEKWRVKDDRCACCFLC